jgi:iron complex outermembrane receptor protein
VGVYYFEELHRAGNGACWVLWNEVYDPVTDADVPCPASNGGFHFSFVQPRTVAGGPQNSMQQTNLYSDSKAVFSHLTYALNDDWDLELGVRWTEDDRRFNIIEFDSPEVCDFDAGWCMSQPVLNDQNVNVNGFVNELSAVFDDVTPMVSLTRNLATGDRLDSGLVYFRIAEGFLTGAFNDEINLGQNPQLEPLVTYGPEHVMNYEVGFKGTFGGGRYRLHADVFWMDYTDKQESINIDNFDGRFGPDPSIELVQNAGTVDIYGFEVELRASPWDGGFVTVDAGYLINEYSEFLSANPENPSETLDLSQTEIDDRTPAWQLNATIGHTFELANGASLTPQVGIYAQGGYEWLAGSGITTDDPHSYCYQDSYSKFRTRITYVPAVGSWEASLFGYNITDERYYDECDTGRAGVFDYRYGAPDQWGLEFIARWGEN